MHGTHDRPVARPIRGIAVVVLGLVVGLLLIGPGLDRGSRSADPTEATADGDVDDRDDDQDAPATSSTTTSTTTLPVRAPAEVKVLVANGVDAEGIATELSNQLAAENGYAVGTPVRTDPIAATSTFYAEGYEGDARELAEIIGFAEGPIEPLPDPPPVADIQGANVVIVLGPDYLIG